MHRGSRVLILSFLSVLFLVALPSIGQEPLEVGIERTLSIQSQSLGRAGGVRTADGWRLEIGEPEATYIAIHFARFNLQKGEKLTISDPFGGQAYTLTGRGKLDAGTFWAQHIKGDKAVLEFSTRRGAPAGFEIDAYAAGFAEIGGVPGPEAICGTDDKENAVCYATNHPTEYDHGRAVARLLIQGTSLCTGWLASASYRRIVWFRECTYRFPSRPATISPYSSDHMFSGDPSSFLGTKVP